MTKELNVPKTRRHGLKQRIQLKLLDSFIDGVSTEDYNGSNGKAASG